MVISNTDKVRKYDIFAITQKQNIFCVIICMTLSPCVELHMNTCGFDLRFQP